MALLIILSIIVLIALAGWFIYNKYHKSGPAVTDAAAAGVPPASIGSFTDELNDFIDEYNSKHGANIPYLNPNMKHVRALYGLAVKHRISSARALLARLTNYFDTDSCAYSCQNSPDCDACCDKECKSSSDQANCKQHCNGVNCASACSDSNSYVGCRQCCERNCNINDYNGQMACIKMCDATFPKQYSSCSDQCTDTTSSLGDCSDCCGKNCDPNEEQLCEARCAAPMLNFILRNRGY